MYWAGNTQQFGTDMHKIIVMALVLTSLAACETAKGVGRDLQKAGGSLTDTAQSVQRKF